MSGSVGRGGEVAPPDIPRLIHRIWLGDDEPQWLRPFAATWQRPGWELRQWTDENVGELFPLRNQAIYDRAEELAGDHVGQLRGDVLRYEILHRFGGVYVDADFECLRPIDELIEGAECFAAWEEEDRWIANGLMGTVAGHPFIAQLIEDLAANVEANRGSRPNKLSGPQYVTRMHREYGGFDLILSETLVYPYGYSDVVDLGAERPNNFDAYAVHHWANRRRLLCLS